MGTSDTVLSGPSFGRTMMLVLVSIVGLFSIDTSLATVERSQTRAEAARAYQAGLRLLKEGQGGNAAEQFRAALTVARDNQDYQLALADALAAAGRLTQAEGTLSDLLQRNADSGAANLALARVLARERKATEAFSYYHRAIYGQWKQDARDHRVQARFELVDLLAAQHEREQLLAELLPLQAEAPNDTLSRMKLGHLFIAAGSPVRGADLFREILQGSPRDPDAYAGLGDAEFARANYRTASSDYSSALRFHPDDIHARQQLEICGQILALDPTQRGLGIEERHRRSLQLLDLVRTDLSGCLNSTASGAVRDLIERAGNALKEHLPARRQNAAYEANLELADQLWQARRKECSASTRPAPEYLALTLNKVAP
jgi:tetratricopeptide (TPR) repeat protein